MSQASDTLGAKTAPEKSAAYVRLISVVSAAHFVSHYYILLLAPLYPLCAPHMA